MSSECDKYRERLDEYLDGTLRADEVRDVVQHLAQCENCANLVEEEKKIIALLQALPQRQAPALLRQRVLSQLDALPARSALRDRVAKLLTLPRLRTAAQVAAVFALILTGLYVFNSGMFGRKLETEVLKSKVSPPAAMLAAQPAAEAEKYAAMKDIAASREKTESLAEVKAEKNQKEPTARASEITPPPTPAEKPAEIAGGMAKAQNGIVMGTTVETLAEQQKLDTLSAQSIPSASNAPAPAKAAEAAHVDRGVEALGRLRDQKMVADRAETKKSPAAPLSSQPATRARGYDEIAMVTIVVRPEKKGTQQSLALAEREQSRPQPSEQIATAEQTVDKVIKQLAEARVVAGAYKVGERVAAQEIKNITRGERNSMLVELPDSSYERFVSNLREAGLRVEVEEAKRTFAAPGAPASAPTAPQERLGYKTSEPPRVEGEELHRRVEAAAPSREPLLKERAAPAYAAARYAKQSPGFIRILIVFADAD